MEVKYIVVWMTEQNPALYAQQFETEELARGFLDEIKDNKAILISVTPIPKLKVTFEDRT